MARSPPAEQGYRRVVSERVRWEKDPSERPRLVEAVRQATAQLTAWEQHAPGGFYLGHYGRLLHDEAQAAEALMQLAAQKQARGYYPRARHAWPRHQRLPAHRPARRRLGHARAAPGSWMSLRLPI